MNPIDILLAQFSLCDTDAANSDHIRWRKATPNSNSIHIGVLDDLDYILLPTPDEPVETMELTKIIHERVYTNHPFSPRRLNARELRYPTQDRARILPFIGELLEASFNEEESLDSIESVVTQWRRVWMKARSRMSKENEIGLFGELSVLDLFIQDEGAQAAAYWLGPGGSLHDFTTLSDCIEVKTNAKGNSMIKISSLDQLKPIDGKTLKLVLVRLRTDDSGSTLPQLISEIRTKMTQESSIHLEKMITNSGYRDFHEGEYRSKYAVASIESIEINNDTPIPHSGKFAHEIQGLVDATWWFDLDEIKLSPYP